MKTPKLHAALDTWSRRQAESGHGALPNLGFGGTLVAVFVTSYFAAQIGNTSLVMILYGPRACFLRGIRVSDWKHGVLSNGTSVGPFAGLVTFVWWIPLIVCAEIAAGGFISFLRTKPRWLSAIARLLSGVMLMIFSWLLWRDGFPWIHPIPLSALIGGGVMTWKAARSAVAL